jgi:hypothetical protein
VAGAGEAVDAAMLAAAIGVDRAVEAYVGRGVTADDRAWVFNGDGGFQPRGFAVDLAAGVEPVAVRLGLRQIEARARAVHCCASAGGLEHRGIRTQGERNRKPLSIGMSVPAHFRTSMPYRHTRDSGHHAALLRWPGEQRCR